ncbi:hypothetical protein DUNSADRAFT_10950, partial [Dunaliella salina]
MEDSITRPLPVPKPRSFPIAGVPPGPRCGHTLTAIAGPEGDLSKARLVLFGGATALEGSGSSNKGGGDGAPSSPGPAASGIRLAGATNDVHVFDARVGRWEKIVPQGEAPSPRAAHAAAAVGNMVVIQGGIGPAGLATEDLHVLDFTDPERPRWHRMYATAAARGDGLLLLCGGRDASGTPMGDAYGFARHRDGRWEWHAAPGAMPTGRYQHGAVFVGNRLHISGGAVGGGRMVDEATSTVVLDTNAGQWVQSVPNAGGSSEDFTRRCRHAVASVGPFVFVYGGLKGSQLLDDLLVADDSNGAELSIFDPRAQPWVQWMDATHGNAAAAQMLAKAAMEEAAAALSVRRVSPMDDLRPTAPDDGHGHTLDPRMVSTPSAIGVAPPVSPVRAGSPDVTLSKHMPGSTPMTPDVRLWHRAVVVHQMHSHRAMHGVHKKVIYELLRPRTWKAPEDRRFFLTASDISELCDTCEAIFREEPTVLQLHAPIKIFGDLHGQFNDLMRLFEEYGTPSTAGDITYIDYLFLGDYAHDINALFGFRLECLERLGEEFVYVWRRINELFNYLPLAASIEGKILCMHGGIGRSINKV